MLVARPVPLPEVSTVSNRDEFFEACGMVQEDETRFETCRSKLPVLSTSFLWVDRRYLLRNNEILTSKHLDIFYGLSGEGAEPARMAIGSILLTRCRKGAPTSAASFEELIKPECLRRIPTLAELGLEMEPEWAGIKLIRPNYDGKMKPFPE